MLECSYDMKKLGESWVEEVVNKCISQRLVTTAEREPMKEWVDEQIYATPKRLAALQRRGSHLFGPTAGA